MRTLTLTDHCEAKYPTPCHEEGTINLDVRACQRVKLSNLAAPSILGFFLYLTLTSFAQIWKRVEPERIERMKLV